MDGHSLEHRRDGPVTSLIFPTYNPGPILERSWRELEHFLRTTVHTWEVLFVCDGCTDGTPARLAKLSLSRPDCVRVLSYPRNRGKGYAIRLGLTATRGHWRIFMDADLAYSFAD